MQPSQSKVTDQADARKRRLEQFDLRYPAELPISAHVDEIRNLLTQHQVIIVAGETGSGKTTQLPKICLEAGYGVNGMIGHTQPRRLAARSVAARIAEELATAVGEGVGYAVRFDDRVSADTVIKLVTDGLLLTEVRRDRDLSAYDVVIVDEAHERSLNIDFLLGVLRRVLAKRPELRVVVTSATIDVERFSSYFGGAPVVEIGGRGFPVDIRYLAPQDIDADADALLTQAIDQVLRLPMKGASDVLVFATGERDIFESAKLLRERYGERLEVLPLYARLRPTDQAKVFKPSGRRRVVLATNVAETSLTVPNIGFVIDPGYARINRYSYRSKLERLPVEAISQASANQRAGRCGRVAPGTCLRLYTQQDFDSRADFTDPEIRRVNLASVVLQMRAFGLGEIQHFGFIEPPEPRAVKDALLLLEELGALRDNKLTNTGRAMSRLPVDPRLARMLVAGAYGNALTEMLIVTSALAVQDPRERPFENRAAADAKHERFLDEHSDFGTLLNLWAWLNNLKASATRSGERKAMVAHFLNPARVREWRSLHRQLTLAAKDLGWRLNQVPANQAEVNNAVLAGSLSLIGVHDEKGVYLGARGSKFRLFPGSTLHGKTPKWVVASDIAETARVYARTVCEVKPRAIEAHAAHLVKRQHSEPHWEASSGEACAYERVTLYGLVLAERRRVKLAKLDPALSRDLFIREGFLQGKMPKKVCAQVACIDANMGEIARIHELEDRGRRRDLMIADDELLAYVDGVLPAQVIDAASLLKWWRRAEEGERGPLFLDGSVLQRQVALGLGESDYPSVLRLGDVRLDVSYTFAPGAVNDGVNVRIPLGVLQGVSPEALEWSVPGYLPRVVDGWLRSLPKQKRRLITPVADRVAAVCEFLLNPARYRQGRLARAMSDAVLAVSDLRTDASDWSPDRLEEVLRVHIVVVGRKGRVVDQGRDLAELQAKHSAASAPVAMDLSKPVAAAIEAFPENLPPQKTLNHSGAPVLVYPALRDQGTTVDLVYAESAQQAAAYNRQGYARLVLKRLGSATRYFRREIDRNTVLGLHFASLGDASSLRDELLRFVVWSCYFDARTLPRTVAEFEQRLSERRPALAEVFDETVAAFAAVLAERFELVRAVDTVNSPALAAAKTDIVRTIERLCPVDVLDHCDQTFLLHLPRYIQAQRYRLENLQGKVTKDADNVRAIKALETRLLSLATHRLTPVAELAPLQQQLEEVRVGLFAQPLALKGLGSVKKLNQAMETLEQTVGLL